MGTVGSCDGLMLSRVGVVYRHVRLAQILSAGLSLRVLHLSTVDVAATDWAILSQDRKAVSSTMSILAS